MGPDLRRDCAPSARKIAASQPNPAIPTPKLPPPPASTKGSRSQLKWEAVRSNKAHKKKKKTPAPKLGDSTATEGTPSQGLPPQSGQGADEPRASIEDDVDGADGEDDDLVSSIVAPSPGKRVPTWEELFAVDGTFIHEAYIGRNYLMSKRESREDFNLSERLAKLRIAVSKTLKASKHTAVTPVIGPTPFVLLGTKKKKVRWRMTLDLAEDDEWEPLKIVEDMLQQWWHQRYVQEFHALDIDLTLKWEFTK